MIKNIIFDLDNTIIEDKDVDVLHYKEALRNCGYSEDNYINVYNALDDYEQTLSEENRFYSRETAIEFLNKKLNTNYDIKLVDELNKVIGKYWINPFLSEDTLKYLASKYKLYVFTNWFEVAQTERLQNIGYLKYFTKVFGSDTVGAKPYLSSYNTVLENIGALPSECIMIGDNKKCDIQGANNAGISAILFDYNGRRDKKDIYAPDYKVVTNLKELENIL